MISSFLANNHRVRTVLSMIGKRPGWKPYGNCGTGVIVNGQMNRAVASRSECAALRSAIAVLAL